MLSCTLSDRIAAVGMVASAQFLPWGWCHGRIDAVPMIAFHGTADRFTRYHGGTSWVRPQPRVSGHPDLDGELGSQKPVRGEPVESVVAADVTRLEYTNCADDAAVVLYTVHGGGHTWPGGGPLPEWFVGHTSSEHRRHEPMWAFFREHPLGNWLRF